ncbi:DNA polymerase III subunit alpha [Marinilabiliaceae bacterium ANBcel2]|nr:DNA polymerase III subunit alpha [Marinilabiliaceae bacterium ANBcel2]
MYLNCHTYHSLCYGTLSPADLVNRVADLGVKTAAITDINSVSGVYDFARCCRNNGIKPVAGVEVRNGNTLLYIAIAQNFDGFAEINRFLSYYNLNKELYPEYPPFFDNVYIVYPFRRKLPKFLNSNEYVGVRHFELNCLAISSLQRQKQKLLILQPITFTSSRGYDVHKHLRAISGNTLLSSLKDNDHASCYDWPVPLEKLKSAFKEFSFIVDNSEKLLDSCSFDFDFKNSKNLSCYTGSLCADREMLKSLAFDGMNRRYGSDNSEACSRIVKELDIIDKLGFAAYFLITYDIVKFSLSKGFYHVGRGSGANSVVAYCLNITDVDPIELSLYFERFLNPDRSSPPDFDIDYSWRDREEVQNYIFDRFGRDNVALLGAISTFQFRLAVRESAKVYGLAASEIEEMLHPSFDKKSSKISAKIFDVASFIKGFPSSRTLHAGGVLIASKPITNYTILELPAKGMPVTQFDMYVAEDIGFEKFDVLSQRGIGHINDSVKLIAESGKNVPDIHDVDKIKNDCEIKELLSKGETVGCFYIESPAMRGLLKKLLCRDYLTLVAASSVIRPGVSRSGMMRTYIERSRNPDKVEYLHPVMEEHLKETYGVMVYQEDVIKICHHFAGLTPADADLLRRAMSGKYRSAEAFKAIADKFISGARQRGHSASLSLEVWRQIESFAGYSFSKAHSASYAVESFQSLYLKAHYPLEFIVSVINNFGGFYSLPVYINESVRYGATIALPCVNNSGFYTSLQGSTIYLGFVHVKDLERTTIFTLEKGKEEEDYKSLSDFIYKTNIGRDQLITLIRVGAFRFTGKEKSLLLWEAHMILSGEREPLKYKLPCLTQSLLEHAWDEILLLGFPITLNMFEILTTSYRGDIKASQMGSNCGQTLKMAGELITVKYVKTVNYKVMYFATFLDDCGEFFDAVIFPDIAKTNPLKGKGVYLIKGLITNDFGYSVIEVNKIAILSVKNDPRA